ncbi:MULTISPECIES: NAD(P)/FAD-dependent oxidoreductase [Priestia]|jgi:thioredoxin reductase (NADPH)|uniref:Ferredoxin--NADP reductase n=6 Tax=Priestia TaxID=2800373 RepID=D5DUQ6_PRIM1|nr:MULTISPECIES: NAD(P)/FAD-dependent oxidoreductase [Priestia]AVX10809.1 NAD(P)/FAD-dependent oxidoreductase [Bacillus sp. Y-01]KOP76874.1 ferredoxin-NADP reductase [Bacillus sp. FJAT-21351]KQU18327.1 ferredoxin-NADP reductase [Bacillus sp. Leaf75]KRD82784.1 ferredoxin-NADP reductase [Bacillus sp. Root147]KRF47659.1 ferredoxin-NADP reductase [Bacillus sp. Soil531]MBK0294660.1 NAD(P)/FAD-dependent oxidoreductase [Bacillus sp. S34]MBU8854831.1 NAD(P)/FAD-dependent oxidoreductase [Bacillus sp.
MKEDKQVYDITIIGGGPTGLFTAFYGGMRQASVKIIESLPQLGGQLSALYPEKYIYDVAGFPKVRAQELVNNLKEQMDQFKPAVALEQAVEKVEKQADGVFRLTTNSEVHYSKTIIITAGNGAFKPRKIELENAEQFEQTNLHYFVDDMNKFKGRKVLVCGGGDSAVDWSLMLEPIAEKVTLTHRRDKFRAHEHSVENLHNSSVDIKTPYVPVEFIGDDRITQVVLENTKGEEKTVVDVDDVIVNFGFVSSLGPIKEWDLDLEKNAIVVNSKQETNIPGIYAAGDVCTYDGKVKLIVAGFGEGPTAVNNAKAYIDPKARLQPMHSTSMFS